MLRAILPGVAIVAAGCQSAAEPLLNEQWVADLVASRQVLYLTFPPTGTSVSGRGTLSGLLETGGESISVKGTRRADTLDLTLVRSGGAQHHLIAAYVANRAALSGQLSGGEFDGLRVAFRKR
jgi:hypothetical protein